MRVNNNIMAMNAYKNFVVNQMNSARSLEKLSSGFRINRANDDPAGLAISVRMRAQIRGLNQASRNAQDGISLLQAAEGGLTEMHSILQRMRELAVKASTGTISIENRGQIQKEINQLTLEINRIAYNTEFNTHKLLKGGKVTGSTPQASGLTLTGGQDAREATEASYTLQVSDEDILTFKKTGGGESTYTVRIVESEASDTQNSAQLDGDNLIITIGREEEIELVDVHASTTFIFKEKEVITFEASEPGAAGEGLQVVIVEAEESDTANDAVFDPESGLLTITIGRNKHGNLLNLKAKDVQDLLDDSGITEFIAIEESGLGEKLSKAEVHTLTGAIQPGDLRELTAGDVSELLASAGITEFEVEVFEGKEGTLLSKAGPFSLTADEGQEAEKASGTITFSETVLAAEGTQIKIGDKTYELYNSDNSDVPTGTGIIAIDIKSATNNQEIINMIVSKQSSTGVNLTREGSSVLKIEANDPGEAGNAIELSVTPGFRGDYILQVGANKSQTFEININDMRTGAIGVSALDFGSAEKASAAIETISRAIDKVSAERSKLGVYQNRLEHIFNNLRSYGENLQSAESRIRDADMAYEMMQFTRNNLLSKISSAMLAQANQASSSVLQLLTQENDSSRWN